MDKKLLLAIALSMGILFAWWKIFPPATPQTAPQQSAPAAVDKGAQPAPAAPAPAAGAAPLAAATRGPEEQIALETADATFVLSTWGGTLRGLRIKDPKYTVTGKDGSKGPLQIVRTDRAEWAPLRVTFPKADFTVAEQAVWTASRPATDTVVFRTETETVAIEKRYRALPSRYQLQLDIVIENKGTKPISQTVNLHLTGKQDPEKKGGSFLSYAEADVTEMVCFVGEKMHRNTIEDLGKEPKEHTGAVRWMAADEKFFTVAAVPHPEDPVTERKCGQRALDALTGELFVTLASRTVPPGGKTTYPVTIYGGPKYTSDLEAIDTAGQESHLEEVVNVTFAVLSRPLLYLLRAFHRVAGNWGVAIILLTLFVKLVTFYPTHRTMMSAKKMQKLAPKVADLRKKHENDRQKLGTETMAMYKAHGVSPFGGCLPSLIQMPIWIALFSTLNYAVELHRAPFAFYIHDLSARDPYFITPLLMGVIMYIQMRMSPAGADPQQQKMMAVMMPIMFTFFSLFLPAGLAIYTLTSYLIGILQQLLVNWLDRRATPAAARA